MLYKICFNVVYGFWKLTGCKIYNADLVPKDTQVVFIGNHRHILDCVPMGMVSVKTKKHVAFIGKKEIFNNKFLAWLFGKLNVIPINREEVDLSTLRTIIEVQKNGNSLAIFPEGTRITTGELGDFKQGAILMAAKGKSPIVPMYIGNSENLLKIWKPRPYAVIGDVINLPQGKIKQEELDKYTEICKASIYKLSKENVRELAH